MKLFCLAVVFVLITVIMNVFSICPESGCGCNEHCVNGSNIWCRNNNDEDCSCKIGCFTDDTLLEPGESKYVFCNICWCCQTISSSVVSYPSCSRAVWCFPEGFTVWVDYPAPTKNNPNCVKRKSTFQ